MNLLASSLIKMNKLPILTNKDMKRLSEEDNTENYSYFDTQSLDMNSHGAIETMCIFQDKETMLIYGFIYEVTSEEWLFDSNETFSVEPYEFKEIRYKRN